MNKIDLKDKKVVLGILDTIDNMFDSTEKTIKKYVQDKSIDLEDRWEVFCKAGKMGLIGSDKLAFYPKGVNFGWGGGTLEDEFYIRKYESYNVIDLLETCIEENKIASEIAYKESCLDEFIFETVNDW